MQGHARAFAGVQCTCFDTGSEHQVSGSATHQIVQKYLALIVGHFLAAHRSSEIVW
ncbi:hypothetical protein EMIT0357P_11214 [Pseudomonas marginalis]